MSLYSICCGSFNQLRNSIGNICSIRLLTYHSRLVYGTLLPSRRHQTKSISTTVLARSTRKGSKQSFSNSRHLHSESVESSIEKFKQSEIEHLKSLQCYNIEEKLSGVKTEWPATILVFDIETTGFSRRNDRIIELAVRDLMGGKNSTFQTLINPEKDVRNAYIHGISNDMVCRPDIPRFGELIPILLQYIWSRQMDGKPVLWVAHNGRSFDVPFLIFEFRRCKVEMPGDWLFVDTLPIARQLVDSNGSKLSSASLGKLRERYKIPLTGSAHRAMQDVTTLCYVLQKLTFELKLTVPQLLEKSFRAADLPATRPEK
uniref:Exonuclease domain-containing protein n=1 Tax=Arundo donax TaxID=35708 RepID=A0A0A9CUW5_ARUDO